VLHNSQLDVRINGSDSIFGIASSCVFVENLDDSFFEMVMTVTGGQFVPYVIGFGDDVVCP